MNTELFSITYEITCVFAIIVGSGLLFMQRKEMRQKK